MSFDLVISANEANSTAELRLCDPNGVQLAYQPVDFNALAPSRRRALFDLHGYLRHYVEPQDRAAEIAVVGVVIAEQVLGKEIFEKLWHPQSQRTLRIVLPGAHGKEDEFVAALARIPWEIARPKPDALTLGERNLVLRVVHELAAPPSRPLALAPGEELRVLFVFAESRDSTPLGMRQERRALQRLFEQEIYPERRVVAHFLSHGVTRDRLLEQVEEWGGYHVVHWSGHGRVNGLELCGAGGEADPISGEELLQMFFDAGGFLPRLLVLSACHSGSIAVRDWSDFLAVAAGRDSSAPSIEPLEDLDLRGQPPGFTGTAHALLQAGVSSVVAMRYSVSDDYARELAVEFYRALLAHAQPKKVAVALARARHALSDPQRRQRHRFSSTDPATPVLFGVEDAGLPLSKGKSSALEFRNRRLHLIGELNIAEHPGFVGRTWELASLGADFIGPRHGADTKPVAMIVGLGGMGKTTLVAEALDLWEQRFDWVLPYQAKPNALSFEATLRDIDLRLREENLSYREHLTKFPADAIYREATADFRDAERNERLSRNLARALRSDKILLVLDNFESSLVPRVADPDSPARACQDPAWDVCLALLARELTGGGSCVLITSRLPLAAIAETAHLIRLGPLSPGEAALLLRSHPQLQAMANHSNADERKLAARLLKASRFHPLLLDRLVRLAARPDLRPQLKAALDALEKTRNYNELPELFATAKDDPREQAYLDDALDSSLDLLIQDVGLQARRLLEMIAISNQPETLRLVRLVWSSESQERERRPADSSEDRPPGGTSSMPREPESDALLRRLAAVGLVTEERVHLEDSNPNLACHELVRGRIRSYMIQHPVEQVEAKSVRLRYAEHLEAAFFGLRHQDFDSALEAGCRAIVYCIQAEAWERLADFGGAVITSTAQASKIGGLIPHLRIAARIAPQGTARWTCLFCLAGALRSAGDPEASIPIFSAAAAEARSVAVRGSEEAQEAWETVAVNAGNLAISLLMVGQLESARLNHLEGAEAGRKANLPAVNIVGAELEALRIDINTGEAAEALPEVESRLARLEAWWEQHRAGRQVPDAPNPEILARTLLGALDISMQANATAKDFARALDRVERLIDVQRSLDRPARELANSRGNRASFLIRLDRFPAAQKELEESLDLLKQDPAGRARALTSLAEALGAQGDIASAISQIRRALSLRDKLPDPRDRAISHFDLAFFLARTEPEEGLADSERHLLAALSYSSVIGWSHGLSRSRNSYGARFRRAQIADPQLEVPLIADLLDVPAFASLKSWLQSRGVDLVELQKFVDAFLEEVRVTALAGP